MSMSQLGGSGDILPRKIFKLKSSEMAGNAFKTNMVCENLFTFSNKKAMLLLNTDNELHL